MMEERSEHGGKSNYWVNLTKFARATGTIDEVRPIPGSGRVNKWRTWCTKDNGQDTAGREGWDV